MPRIVRDMYMWSPLFCLVWYKYVTEKAYYRIVPATDVIEPVTTILGRKVAPMYAADTSADSPKKVLTGYSLVSQDPVDQSIGKRKKYSTPIQGISCSS